MKRDEFICEFKAHSTRFNRGLISDKVCLKSISFKILNYNFYISKVILFETMTTIHLHEGFSTVKCYLLHGGMPLIQL